MNSREARASVPDIRSPGDVLGPPLTFLGTLKYLGPGLIVTGSIVGSGELIATTTLAARVGFTLLWFLILSCVIKTFIQIELGRYSISSGETTMQAFSHLPGPRNWLVWWWPIMMAGTFLQIGGIVGGVAQIMDIAFGSPWGHHKFWIIPIALSGILLLIGGKYGRVEKVTVFLVFLFSAVTVLCGLLLQGTTYAIRPSDLAEGFRFRLPHEGLMIAFAAFGITGVGATELVFYPYWCLEKGYARSAGPRTDSPDWEPRARGWIGVLRTDAWLSTVVFTVVTVAFYLLGGAVLHSQGLVPKQEDMVQTLSEMYTRTIGSWGMVIFLVGAFAVLYSTFFVSTASHARVLADCVNVLGLVRFKDSAQRLRWIRGFVIAFPVLYSIAYLITAKPVLLVLIGAIFQASTLPFIAFAAIYLRYRRTDARLRPGLISDHLLWLAYFGVVLVGVYQLIDRVVIPLLDLIK